METAPPTTTTADKGAVVPHHRFRRWTTTCDHTGTTTAEAEDSETTTPSLTTEPNGENVSSSCSTRPAHSVVVPSHRHKERHDPSNDNDKSTMVPSVSEASGSVRSSSNNVWETAMPAPPDTVQQFPQTVVIPAVSTDHSPQHGDSSNHNHHATTETSHSIDNGSTTTTVATTNFGGPPKKPNPASPSSRKQQLKSIESTLLTDIRPNLFVDTCEAVKMRRRKSVEHYHVAASPSSKTTKRRNSKTNRGQQPQQVKQPQQTSKDGGNQTPEITVGTRLKVYWKLEKAYFAGTIQKVCRGKKKPYWLVYDDGDKEWVDLNSVQQYQILPQTKSKQLPVSSKNKKQHNRTTKAREPHKKTTKPTRKRKPTVAPAVSKPTKPFQMLQKKDSLDDWVSAGMIPRHPDDDSSTDEEELDAWAVKMLGAPPSILGRRRSQSTHRNNNNNKSLIHPRPDKEQFKRRKEEARPLSVEEIRSILAEECSHKDCSTWVRRSVRQPNKSALDAPQVKALLDKLRGNDSDMVVLKMKKYCSDPATPTLVIDAVLDALEENTNCQALYIQNFNEGMQDDQVMHLLRILQSPTCNIWCLNIGETYKVNTKTWQLFANGLKDTNITHMYASEHTITTELKDQIRATIRDNRSKHTRHNDPNNLDVIIQCTHNWWNPINAKVLRPYLNQYEALLQDPEALGLQGTLSGANLS